jgi:hypothetical protein
MVVIGVCASAAVHHAYGARAALTSASDHAKDLKSALTGGDADRAARALHDLRLDTERARQQTDGPIWRAAAHLPLIGDNFGAIATVAGVLDVVADEAAPPIIALGSGLDPQTFAPSGGKVDLAELKRIAPAATKASSVLAAQAPRLDALDIASLYGRIAGPLEELQGEFQSARRAAQAAALTATLAPDLLGASGPRNYLLVVQNNAELRSTGGIVGAFVILHAKGGKLTIDEPGSNADLIGGIGRPVLALSDEETVLFSSAMGTDVRDTNFTPDFPRAAALDQAIVAKRLGKSVDGVLSVDPVALSYLLRGTGNVKLADGTVLTPENAVRVLLSDVYREYTDPREQDAYFAAAAKAVFDRVASGSGDSAETVKALSAGVSERRIMFWSAKAAEQEKLASTALANALPGATDSPALGVYLNDSTNSKLQYYLDAKTTAESTSCSSAGSQTIITTTTLASRVPIASSSLPDYVLGASRAGEQDIVVRMYGPAGGLVTSVTLDGREQPFSVLHHNGRPVAYVIARLRPGSSSIVEAMMSTRSGQRESGRLLTTPTIKSTPNNLAVSSACR